MLGNDRLTQSNDRKSFSSSDVHVDFPTFVQASSADVPLFIKKFGNGKLTNVPESSGSI